MSLAKIHSDISTDTLTSSKTGAEVIVALCAQDVKPGHLNQLFRNGTKVVLLKNDPRIGKMWTNTMVSSVCETLQLDFRRKAWDGSIFDIARNHQPGELCVGDMLRFIPDGIGQWARKVKVSPIDGSSKLQTIPGCFVDGAERVMYREEHLQEVCALMREIFESAVPKNHPLSGYAMTIEILKYPQSPNDLRNLIALLADSSGQWTRLGQTLDTYKAMAAGIFQTKYIRDCFAVSSLVPGVKTLLHWVNACFAHEQKLHRPTNSIVIGADHVDLSKYFSCLAGDRDNIRTQIYTGKKWMDVDLTPNTLAIFPSQKSRKAFGLTPTRHRVLFEENQGGRSESKDNVTLGFFITDG